MSSASSPESLFEDTKSLVTRESRRYSSAPPEIRKDLEQAGHIALLTAVRTFDPGRACAFSTYASVLIRHAMSKEWRDNQGPVRVTDYEYRKNGYPHYVSIEAVTQGDDHDSSERVYRGRRGETLASLSMLDPTREELEIKKDAEKLLSELPDDEKELIRLHLGFDEERCSFREIGRRLGITGQAVQRGRV